MKKILSSILMTAVMTIALVTPTSAYVLPIPDCFPCSEPQPVYECSITWYQLCVYGICVFVPFEYCKVVGWN